MTLVNQFFCGHDGDPMEVTNVATSGFRNPQEWLLEWATGGVRSDAGLPVNGYSALTHAPIWQGINIIAGDVGCVPVRLVKDEFDNQKNHPAWKLLRLRANAMQTPGLWKETMMQWALMWGNGISWIIRQGSRPVELIPLRPDCIRFEMLEYRGHPFMVYHYTSPVTGFELHLLADDVVHIQGLTGDGIIGYPLFQIARNTIGHGLALQKHGNKSFSNGARPSGVLEHPAKLDEQARGNLRREWEAIHGGANNSGRTAILWEGMKFNPISMSNIDAQWLEAKKFDRQEAASLLNLPPHKLGGLEDSSTRSNLEEQNADYVQRTLTRWFNRLAEEFRRKLLTEAEWLSDRFSFVWDVDTFLKADTDTHTTVIDRMVKATVINPNEGRAMIGLPPRPGGEVYGSPAINPNPEPDKSADTASESEEAPPTKEDEKAQARYRARLAESLKKIAARERKELTRAATHEPNFLKWLDDYYGGDGRKSGLGRTLESTLSSRNGGFRAEKADLTRCRSRLVNWMPSRKEQLLELSSHVTAKELAGAVEKFGKDTDGQLLSVLEQGES